MLPLIAAQRAWQLCKHAYGNRRGLARLNQCLRWSVLAALSPRAALDWFALCAARTLQPFCERQRVLPLKALRPYVSLRWSSQRRMRVILETYEFLHQAPALLREAILHPEGAVLARTRLPGVRWLALHLGWDQRFRKEGELVLSLRMLGDPARALAMSLAFERAPSGAWHCYIGCVQGGDETPERIRELTKVMHGLRPKSLLLFAAQELTHAVSVEALLGVSRAIQVYRSKQWIRLRAQKIQFDYDRFWSEAGGRCDAEGWYRLPPHTVRRAREAIATNKRAQYARRYQLMDDLTAQMHSQLTARPPLASAPRRKTLG